MVVRRCLNLLRLIPRRRLVLLLLLMVVAGVGEGVGILLLVPLLDLLQGGSAAGHHTMAASMVGVLSRLGLPHGMPALLLGFVLLVSFCAFAQYARGLQGARLQYQLVDELRHRCFKGVLGAEWRWLVTGRQSDHLNLLLTEVNRIGIGLQYGLALLATLATMAAYVLAALALSWQVTLVALLSGAVLLLLLSGQRRKALQLGQNVGAANRALQAHAQESLAGIKLAKVLANEQRHLAFFLNATQTLRAQQLHFMAGSSLTRALFQAGGAALLAAYLFAGVSVWQTPIPQLLTLVLVFSRLIPMFSLAQQQSHHLWHALPALQEVQQFLAACEAAAEPAHTSGHSIWPVGTSICLDAVSVCYPGRSTPALDQLSLCFPARTTTAIMGASGAGKSTLADVLIGLLQPDAGCVRIDGVAVADSARLRWRHSVAYVPQEVFLFNDSIRNNLLWACPHATEHELHQALQRAAADFVFALPQGLDSMVGDGGLRISGGERQRIALARALLKKPSLLILDEATSALDMESEARVRQAIENLHGDLTVVLIGHRVATLEHADQVVVLNHGRISRQGSWAELGPATATSVENG